MKSVPPSDARRRWALRLLIVLAGYQVLLGAWFIVIRPPLLPEDLHYMQLDSLPDTTLSWLDLVFSVMGGQMMATGLLLVPAIARLGSRQSITSLHWACLLGAAAASAGTMSVVNFLLGSDFRWTLLVPVLVWGAVLALTAADRARS